MPLTGFGWRHFYIPNRARTQAEKLFSCHDGRVSGSTFLIVKRSSLYGRHNKLLRRFSAACAASVHRVTAPTSCSPIKLCKLRGVDGIPISRTYSLFTLRADDIRQYRALLRFHFYLLLWVKRNWPLSLGFASQLPLQERIMIFMTNPLHLNRTKSNQFPHMFSSFPLDSLDFFCQKMYSLY